MSRINLMVRITHMARIFQTVKVIHPHGEDNYYCKDYPDTKDEIGIIIRTVIIYMMMIVHVINHPVDDSNQICRRSS